MLFPSPWKIFYDRTSFLSPLSTESGLFLNLVWGLPRCHTNPTRIPLTNCSGQGRAVSAISTHSFPICIWTTPCWVMQYIYTVNMITNITRATYGTHKLLQKSPISVTCCQWASSRERQLSPELLYSRREGFDWYIEHTDCFFFHSKVKKQKNHLHTS